MGGGITLTRELFNLYLVAALSFQLVNFFFDTPHKKHIDGIVYTTVDVIDCHAFSETVILIPKPRQLRIAVLQYLEGGWFNVVEDKRPLLSVTDSFNRIGGEIGNVISDFLTCGLVSCGAWASYGSRWIHIVIDGRNSRADCEQKDGFYEVSSIY